MSTTSTKAPSRKKTTSKKTTPAKGSTKKAPPKQTTPATSKKKHPRKPAGKKTDAPDTVSFFTVPARQIVVPEKHPGGQPTTYRPEFCDLAYKFCLLNATDKQLADSLGIAESTLNNWKNAHPEFLESIKEGKDIANARVAESLFARATGFYKKVVKIFMPAGAKRPVVVEYEEYFPPDTAAAFIILKNRAGWKNAPNEAAGDGLIERMAEVIAKIRGPKK